MPARSIAEAQLDALFQAAPAGLGLWDADVRFVRLNAALAEINGLPIDAHVGRRPEELLGPLGERIADLVGEVVRTGEPQVDVEVRGTTPAELDAVHDWLASFYPVTGASGELVGVGAVVTDITARKAAERDLAEARRRAATLAEASKLLAGSLDLQETIDQVAELLVPELADGAFVELLQPDGTIERVGLAHRDPARLKQAQELRERYPLDPASSLGSPEVLRSGEPDWASEVTGEMLEAAAVDPDHRRLLQALEIRAYMIVPLRARGAVLGTLALAMAEPGRTFDEGVLAFAQDLADRCALAIDNARLYSERADLAHTLQTALLPPAMPEPPGWQLATRYRAAGAHSEVGGDFYDAVRFDHGWALMIGDVTGKGARAAALTALARHTLHTALKLSGRAGDAMWHLNERLIARPELSLTSAAIVVLPDAGDHVDVAVAGHPPPLLRSGGRVHPLGRAAPVLGALPCDPGDWTTSRHRVEPGDDLLLYTDGVLDAVGPGERFGEHRLREVVATADGTAHDLAAAVETALDAFEAGPQADDVALLALRRDRAPG